MTARRKDVGSALLGLPGLKNDKKPKLAMSSFKRGQSLKIENRSNFHIKLAKLTSTYYVIALNIIFLSIFSKKGLERD